MVGRRHSVWASASLLVVTSALIVIGCKETAIIKVAADAAPITTSDVKIIEPGSCPPGQSLGCVNVYGRKVCNDEGTAYVELPCGSGELCLGDDQCIPAICIPNDRICVGIHRVGECVADGSRYESVESCGPGLTCEDGNCISTCTSGQKATTNVGCNYALVDLGNFESGPQNEATDKPVLVVVSNVSGSADANISILSRKTGLPLEYPAADLIVPKQDLRTLLLPTKQALLTTAHSLDSWLLTSDQPITVSLINPENGLDVRSNDATLLFPTDALGNKYIVMGWESIWSSAQGFDAEGFPIYGFPSYVTIVATASGETTVQITPASDVRSGKELDGSVMSRLPAGKLRSHVMREGEVLNYALEPRVGNGDFTGTTVESDRPIAVFFAHNCGFVPDINTPFCDHMGHQLAPIDTWGKTYIADIFSPRSATGYFDIFRVMASRDGTVVTCEPAIEGCSGETLKKGEWIEYRASVSHLVKANNPVQIGHFMTGSNYEGYEQSCGQSNKTGIGDPAFTIGVAIDQYLDSYVFLTPPGYSDDWINVTHKAGIEVVLDGKPIGPPAEIVGDTGYVVTRVRLDDGAHRIESSEPFGIIAYGYDCDVSYAYPGGMLLGTN